MTGHVAPPPVALPDILAEYRPKPGVADELFDTNGAIRPVWNLLIEHLSCRTPDVIEEHFARGPKYLRDAGVYFRQYSTIPAPEREWPLSPVPVIIHEDEWAAICAGLTQRADLLEMVMADLYGPARLISDGHLPAELIAHSPEWLRPLVGVKPASGHFLHQVSFEISRNPDGTWFVLGDRTQAPSGAGFALENRIATTRIFNDLYPRSNVHRLSGFFRSFRDAMDQLPGKQGRRAAILTPGPNNAGYFEHTYIARYLGLLLLEGEDMLVRDGEVMVRTVEGPEPLGAIWRRVDSDYLDPLELREDSQLGTPGLVNALRQESIDMINALGSGILEMRAMMAFLPRISKELTGAPLQMPNIATWWCGQSSARDYVKTNLDRMMIGGARDLDLPFDVGATTAQSEAMRDAGPDKLEAWIDAEGKGLVGQELVTVSTAPAYVDGKLMPRPMTVRVTAARTPNGWNFMPGGYARFGLSDAATAMAMQHGGSVADVWVVSDAPVPASQPVVESSAARIEPEALPSRAAENLFWLGRYVERIDAALRMIRAYHLRLAETGDPEDPRLFTLGGFMGNVGIAMDATIPSALMSLLSSAHNCASKVRDRFSPDGWEALQDIGKSIERLERSAAPGDDCARAMSILLRKVTGFSGLVQENMYRSAGWRFLALGRALERCDSIAMSTIVFADPGAPQGCCEIAIELGDNAMTHRRRFRGSPSPQSVRDLLICDPFNPRSALFQLDQILELARFLPKGTDGRPSELERIILPLQAKFAVADAEYLTADDLGALRMELSRASDVLWSIYLR
ncbi:hypothetical protein E4Z66_18070 [Aliishimia ponticola]|uniref:Uncharacterized protein n=1 Tax=Aliishimia ponticola TaxID=2499833 RepID=A0A4S4N6U5_9RHOB|nr:circularly permuted type 2 ATP-grasp protein [Aliishimia ponticola]THH34864.1 hypothetical protein E4Z66_18070 [Aliishimia ponticola]